VFSIQAAVEYPRFSAGMQWMPVKDASRTAANSRSAPAPNIEKAFRNMGSSHTPNRVIRPGGKGNLRRAALESALMYRQVRLRTGPGAVKSRAPSSSPLVFAIPVKRMRMEQQRHQINTEQNSIVLIKQGRQTAPSQNSARIPFLQNSTAPTKHKEHGFMVLEHTGFPLR
jgi:hypothetical protein